ncbi:MAG TPA: metallophosphoesterase [Myxococcaceae bacterium]|jgi:hypothetical protein
MPDIRYIVVSDLHLGAHTSLLTALTPDGRVDPSRPSEPLASLAAALRELVAANEGPEKPVLVLNGDVIELALATTNVAVTCFQRFLEALMPAGQPPIFSRVVYLPGNHDHHVWKAAREQQYCAEVMRLQPGGSLPQVPHITPLLGAAPVRAALLDTLAGVDRLGVPMDVVYPNLALRSASGRRLVVIHHGHFLEPLYSAMSQLLGALIPDRQPPRTVAELEADNGAWIDFFWSSMGSSGNVGPDVAVLYEKLQSKEQTRKLKPNGVFTSLETFLFDRVLAPIALPLLDFFRGRSDQDLTEEERRGLCAYLSGPLRRQILDEVGPVPPSVAFVFGHTHRAFARALDVPGFAQPVEIFNTGGWVVDAPAPEPLNGASMLLVSEDLEIAPVRLYADTVDLARVEVPESTQPFQQRMAKLLDGTRWQAFARAARPAVEQRREGLAHNVSRAI